MTVVIQILTLLPALIKAILAIEEAVSEAGKGKEKSEMVVETIKAVSKQGVELAESGLLQKVIDIVVSFFNKTGTFSK
jgi:hypothetical protein